MINADPRKRLLDLAGARGVSLSQLSSMLGRNVSYLQQFVRKGSPRKLEERDRQKLASFFGVDQAELGGAQDISSRPSGKSPRSGWIAVPRLGLDASAGPGRLTGEGEEPIGAFGFTADWLRARGLDPAMLSAIAVAGDSMDPTLRDGDEILVDRTPRPPRDGIHVVMVEGALLVKRLDTGRPGTIGLISDNDAYSRVDLPAAGVRVIGRVIWKGGRL